MFDEEDQKYLAFLLSFYDTTPTRLFRMLMKREIMRLKKKLGEIPL